LKVVFSYLYVCEPTGSVPNFLFRKG